MFIFGITMVSTILLCILANNLLLNPFYTKQKEKVLREAYKLIDGYSENGDLDTEKFTVGLDQVAARYNLEILVLDTDTSTIRTTVNDSRILTDRLLGYIFGDKPVDQVIYSCNEYTVQKNTDPRMHTEYIELWGSLKGNRFVLMRSPMESIKTSAHVANRLLMYVGAVVLILGLIINLLLSGRVTDPIVELSNLQAELNKKVEAEKMRNDFISNVSHELKTPIALIQGYAEGLKDCVNSDEESRDYYCDVIMDEAGRMNKLVKSLLELIQLENSNDSISLERFDITEMVSNCIQADDILIKREEIQVELIAERPMYVYSDEFKLEQVINNYLSNAIHYCKNEKKIEVKIVRNGALVRVSVFNSGDPIPEDAIPNLWTKFYKVDKARTREYGGSGIGLSIVKAVMESLHHDYGVENHENGVEFWLETDADKGQGKNEKRD